MTTWCFLLVGHVLHGSVLQDAACGVRYCRVIIGSNGVAVGAKDGFTELPALGIFWKRLPGLRHSCIHAVFALPMVPKMASKMLSEQPEDCEV
ncbi:expressed unknown protein [Seminavis robusta]|uniref:Secreted protein n=1 Tax=Seminavis robusta TaxID=568900 RepID=A0A9N8HC39_9STRA|nr:expressed unknown protein [Seminavis robusta]|eukprot:Sro364_g127041.1  (93) ;mRNA; f:19089-19367